MLFFSCRKFEVLQIDFKQIVVLFVQPLLPEFQLVFYEQLDLLLSSVGFHSCDVVVHMDIPVQLLAMSNFQKFGDETLGPSVSSDFNILQATMFSLNFDHFF